MGSKYLIAYLKDCFDMSKMLQNPHQMLTRLVGLNIAFDVLSIPIWIAFNFTSSTLSTTTVSANVPAALVDAAVAVAVFTVAIYGLVNDRKWGAYLAIGGTVGQRVIGVFIFPLNVGMGVEVVWSLLIIFFAYKVLSLPKIVLPAQASTLSQAEKASPA